MELVRSRTRRNLYGAVTTPKFRIDRGDDQTHFTDKIRIDDGCGINSSRPTRVLNHDAVSQHRSEPSTDAGECGALAPECALSRRACRDKIVETAQNREHVQDIVAN